MAPFYLRPDRDNWLEKLNEWNDKRRALQWNDAQRKTADGTWKWFSTPSLREMDITDCIGVGASKLEAREVAAKMLSDKSKLWI